MDTALRQQPRKQDSAKEKTLKHQVTLDEAPPELNGTPAGTSAATAATTAATSAAATAAASAASASLSAATANGHSSTHLSGATSKGSSLLKALATPPSAANLTGKRTSSSHWAKLRNLTSALDSLRWLRLKEKAKDPKLLFKLRDELTSRSGFLWVFGCLGGE